MKDFSTGSRIFDPEVCIFNSIIEIDERLSDVIDGNDACDIFFLSSTLVLLSLSLALLFFVGHAGLRVMSYQFQILVIHESYLRHVFVIPLSYLRHTFS